MAEGPFTRDRKPGPLQEEEIQFTDRTADGDTAEPGALRRLGGDLRYLDSQGQLFTLQPLLASAAEETALGTTNPAYQQRLRLTTPATWKAGDYLIGWFAEMSQSKTKDIMSLRVQVDDVTTIAESQAALSEVDIFTAFSGFARVTLTAGAHNIDIDWAATSGGFIATIRRARIIVRGRWDT